LLPRKLPSSSVFLLFNDDLYFKFESHDSSAFCPASAPHPPPVASVRVLKNNELCPSLAHFLFCAKNDDGSSRILLVLLFILLLLLLGNNTFLNLLAFFFLNIGPKKFLAPTFEELRFVFFQILIQLHLIPYSLLSEVILRN